MEQRVKVNAGDIMERLAKLQSDMDYVKEHMTDADSILTVDENKELDESLRELEKGETSSLGDIEKDRENA